MLFTRNVHRPIRLFVNGIISLIFSLSNVNDVKNAFKLLRTRIYACKTCKTRMKLSELANSHEICMDSHEFFQRRNYL